MICLSCNQRIRHPKGITRDTQKCGRCRGIYTGNALGCRSRLDKPDENSINEAYNITP